MADTYISRAATGSVTSSTTFTFSFWLKRGDLNRTQTVFMHENASGHYEKFQLELQSDNTFRVSIYDGSTEFNYDTNMLFRDTSGWYNIVVRWDTTQSTSTDRVRIYVNGSQITFDNANGSTATMPNQNFAINLGEKIMVWGRYQASSPGAYFSGSLSHCHYADGQSYAPTVFGSVDSTTGEWKLNTTPTVTYGNNGFFVLKDGNRVVNDAGNSSGNFAVGGGTLTKTEDCPSNNFPTFITASHSGSYTFYNGATTSFGNGTSDWSKATIGTLGASDGKYYWEIKLGMNGGATDYNITGVVRSDKVFSNSNVYSNGGFNGLQSANAAGGLGIYSQTGASMGGALYIGGSSVNLTNGAIVMYALDLDNKKMWVGKNGTWANAGSGGGVGNPATGANPLWGTGEFTTGAIYLPGNIQYQTSDCSYNFGNGYFKTTAVASAGTNASGNGIFEYDVPTGFTALSTKGLNT